MQAVWTNADEVEAFLNEHRDTRYEVGDNFTLPDIDQQYAVIAVRMFKHGKRFRLYVDLSAECAVAGCSELLVCSKEVHEWRASPWLPRSCEDHRRQFSTPMPHAWKTSDKVEELLAAKAAKLPKARKPRPVGSVQAVLLGVLEDMAVVSDQPAVELVLASASRCLPAAVGARDTRRQRLVRALDDLASRGLVRVSGGCVVC